MSDDTIAERVVAAVTFRLFDCVWTHCVRETIPLRLCYHNDRCAIIVFSVIVFFFFKSRRWLPRFFVAPTKSFWFYCFCISKCIQYTLVRDCRCCALEQLRSRRPFKNPGSKIMNKLARPKTVFFFLIQYRGRIQYRAGAVFLRLTFTKTY